MYPLKLQAVPHVWRVYSVRKADPRFLKVKQKIFLRDDYSCQFCGFQSKGELIDVVNLDGDYRRNIFSNMVTACRFCLQCFFLESVGKERNTGGILVYLPEMSQNSVNAVCHTLFCSMSSDTQHKQDAQSIYRGLKSRAKIVEKELGDGMSNPALLGTMLVETNEEYRNEINKIISDKVRLLPAYNKFVTAISEAWKTVDESKSGSMDKISQYIDSI